MLDGIPNKVFEKVHSLFGVGNENIKYVLHTLETLWKKEWVKQMFMPHHLISGVEINLIF